MKVSRDDRWEWWVPLCELGLKWVLLLIRQMTPPITRGGTKTSWRKNASGWNPQAPNRARTKLSHPSVDFRYRNVVSEILRFSFMMKTLKIFLVWIFILKYFSNKSFENNMRVESSARVWASPFLNFRLWARLRKYPGSSISDCFVESMAR